ncbi:MAG: hypothetical protein Q9M10_00980, partial [Mariprofundaceae bacterium]|nr:hypothetical protein [Mariprofundaceae bacterium]
HNAAEAVRILRQHAIAWEKLTKQRRYAKVKEAQQNRYAKHVVMGEEAKGVPKQPETIKQTSSHKEKNSHKALLNDAQAGANGAQNHGDAIESAALSLLKKENTDLKKRLNDLEAALSKMSSQPTAEQALAASRAQVKRLEIQLARQNGALQKARQAMQSQQGDDSELSLLTWILLAVATLLSILIGYLVYMLKGKRQHPVEQEQQHETSQESNLDDLANHVDAPAMNEATFDAGQDLAPSDAFEGIPDLTDEDTSEMEAFQNSDEEPDPNIDYLSEADVYTRYGMDDEAEKQVNMALRLREDNKDAHIKRVEIRHARGDQAGVKEALKAAKIALAGSSLAMFMAAYEALASGEAKVENESEASVPEDASADVGEFDL